MNVELAMYKKRSIHYHGVFRGNENLQLFCTTEIVDFLIFYSLCTLVPEALCKAKFLRGEIIERREGRSSGHISCKSHFHT